MTLVFCENNLFPKVFLFSGFFGTSETQEDGVGGVVVIRSFPWKLYLQVLKQIQIKNVLIFTKQYWHSAVTYSTEVGCHDGKKQRPSVAMPP